MWACVGIKQIECCSVVELDNALLVGCNNSGREIVDNRQKSIVLQGHCLATGMQCRAVEIVAICKGNNHHTKHKSHQRCCGNINDILWRQPKCIKRCCNKKHECTEQPPRKASIGKSRQHKQRPRTGKRHCYARDTEQIARSETMIQDELPRSLLIRL